MADAVFSCPDSCGPDKFFHDALRDGKFLIQRSQSSGAYVFFPRAIAPGTGADDLEWVEASGKAVVHASTIVRRPAKYGGDYNLTLVELEEGPRLMSRVVNIAPADVTIGMALKAKIIVPDFGPNAKSGEPLVVFEALEGEAA